MDHADTYEPQVLTDIIELFVTNCSDMKIMEDLTKQGQSHGSDVSGSIEYASMHVIMFKDVIHKNNLHSLFYPFNTDDSSASVDVAMLVPDCIISIGGSVEKRFGEVRQLIREAFRNIPHSNNNLYYHPALSIRMLSRAGQLPVYYRHKTHEITVDAVLSGQVTTLYQSDKTAKAVNEDLDIIKEDIGMSILNPIYRHTPTAQASSISLWKRIIVSLIDKCLDTWRIHARPNLTCQCSINDISAVDQVMTHWKIANNLHHTNDIRSIIERIVKVLENELNWSFGETSTSRRNTGLCANKETTKAIIDELDAELDQILIDFVGIEFS
jgi:hypothetical protein